MPPEAIEIRSFQPADAKAVSALIRQVFDEHVAPTFEPEGIVEFHAFASAQAIVERAATDQTFVAWSRLQGEGQAVGVIAVRDMDHVSLLFVRSSHMGYGIATALMARAADACRAAGQPTMTVNSSLNAQSFYERLGFVTTDESQKVQGFAFVPMEKTL